MNVMNVNPQFTSILEVSIRAVFVYGAGFLIVRIAKNRLPGRNTAFDI